MFKSPIPRCQFNNLRRNLEAMLGNDHAAAKSQDPFGPVDAHVHVVGNGSGGTGCRLHIDWWHKPLAALMVRAFGLPMRVIEGDLDALYVARLLQMVRESSLSAIVILAQERVYDDQGRVLEGRGSMYVPNHYVLALARKHPEFLPAVSIHPARTDALDELERCAGEGAVMMKCLPNVQNIDCMNRRFTRFWERMAELELPLLAHTGGEHTLPVIRAEYADPRTLQLPLDCGVTVIAAHSGTKSGLFDPEYFHEFVKMTRRYPRLYGDNSAFNVPIRGRHSRECTREPLQQRILHGSDLPVPVHGHWAWLHGFVDWNTFRRWETQPNLLERDYQLKRAVGFSDDVFTRIWDLIPARVKRARMQAAKPRGV